VGIKGPNWLLDAVMAMPAIIIMTIWAAVGYYMIIFMAGLADIPDIFYEAAKVDGWPRETAGAMSSDFGRVSVTGLVSSTSRQGMRPKPSRRRHDLNWCIA